MYLYLVVGGLVLAIFFCGLHRVGPHERALVLRRGRRPSVRGPGLAWIWPLGIDRLCKVEVRRSGIRPPQPQVSDETRDRKQQR